MIRFLYQRSMVVLLMSALIFMLGVPVMADGQTATPKPPLSPITAQNARNLTRIGTIGTGKLTGSAWSPTGAFIAYTTATSVWLIDTKSYQRQQIATVDNASYPIFSADGRLLAWIATNNQNESTITVWDTGTHLCVFESGSLPSTVYQLVFASDGHMLYSASSDGQLRVSIL